MKKNKFLFFILIFVLLSCPDFFIPKEDPIIEKETEEEIADEVQHTLEDYAGKYFSYSNISEDRDMLEEENYGAIYFQEPEVGNFNTEVTSGNYFVMLWTDENEETYKGAYTADGFIIEHNGISYNYHLNNDNILILSVINQDGTTTDKICEERESWETALTNYNHYLPDPALVDLDRSWTTIDITGGEEYTIQQGKSYTSWYNWWSVGRVGSTVFGWNNAAHIYGFSWEEDESVYALQLNLHSYIIDPSTVSDNLRLGCYYNGQQLAVDGSPVTININNYEDDYIKHFEYELDEFAWFTIQRYIDYEFICHYFSKSGTLYLERNYSAEEPYVKGKITFVGKPSGEEIYNPGGITEDIGGEINFQFYSHDSYVWEINFEGN